MATRTKTIPVRSSRKTPRILGADGRPIEAAYFDAADTTRLNQKHWDHAVGGDLNELLRADLETLRRRCRYEIYNNGYGAGIVDTLAMDIVGSGPYPQITSGPEDADESFEAFDQEAEEKFVAWAAGCDWQGQMDLAEFLQMQIVRQPCIEGGSLTILKRDPDVRYKVSLRLLAVDMDRLAAPQKLGDPRIVDGIEFDSRGRPAAYHILRAHPSDPALSAGMESDAVPASDVVHLYRLLRPGQTHGLPWLSSSLPLFAQLRRFSLATLDAAEAAADQAGVLQTRGNDVEPDENYGVEDVFELERKALLMVPAGYEMKQMVPEHPATTYAMFKAEILNEIARPVQMPYNVAAMNSAQYNYASGRLDHQKYHRFIKTIRAWAEQRLLRRIFAAWISEAYLIGGYFETAPTWEQILRAIRLIRWFWPGFEHVDPVKEASAENTRLGNGTETLEDAWASRGHDWRRKMIQRAKEIRFCRDNAIPMPGQLKPLEKEDEDEEQNDEQETKSQTETADSSGR